MQLATFAEAECQTALLVTKSEIYAALIDDWGRPVSGPFDLGNRKRRGDLRKLLNV